jgi:hypothetical protein
VHHVPQRQIPVDHVPTAKFAAMVNAFAPAAQQTALANVCLQTHAMAIVLMAKFAAIINVFALPAQKNAMISA